MQPTTLRREEAGTAPNDVAGLAVARLRSRLVVLQGLFTILYVACVVVGRLARPAGTGLALVWPAAAVAVLWLGLTWSPPRARWLSAALILVAGTTATAATGVPASVARAYGLANVIEAVVAAGVYHRLRRGRWRIRAVEHLNALLAACTVGSLAGAAAVTGVLWAVDLPPPWTMPGQWWLRHGASMFLLGGVVLVLARPSGSRVRGAAGRAEIIAMWLATGVVYTVIFWVPPPSLSVGFPVIPISVWVALRSSTRHSTLHLLAATGLVTSATMMGHGVFSHGSRTEMVVVAQAFMAVVALVQLTLSLDADRRHAVFVTAVAQAQRLSTVLETVEEGIAVVDPAGRYLLRNRAAQRLLGAAPPAVRPETWATSYGLYTPTGDSYPPSELPFARALAGEAVRDVEILVRTPGSREDRFISVTANPITTDGGITGAVSAFRDVTTSRRQAEEVRRTRDLFGAVLDGATEQAIIAVDAAGIVTVFNSGAERMLGVRSATAVGRQLSELLRAEPGEQTTEPAAELLRRARSSPHTGVYRLRRDHAASPLIASLSVSPRSTAEGTPAGFIIIAADVTAEHHATQALEHSEARAQLLFDSAPIGMAVIRLRQGRLELTRVNDAVCALLGTDAFELIGSDLRRAVHPDHRVAVQRLVDELVSRGTIDPVELRLVARAGVDVWASCSATVLPPDGDGECAVLQLTDVTEQKAAEARLAHQARHDPLTGLANRVQLEDRLRQALRDGRAVGVLYLDLDGFKGVNDSAGHGAGDAVLVETAERLRGCVRPGDTIARIGGDEFIVLCPDLADSDQAATIAERILAMLRRPFVLPTGRVSITGSIGISVSSPGVAPDDLLGCADESMYRAKRGGKNQSVLAPLPCSCSLATPRLLPQIRSGLAAGQFIVHGQPIHDLRTGQVVAVETLLRWNHPTRGLIRPADFLPVAESSPLMLELGARALEESCRQAANWLELLGPDAPAVHVNVSGRQLEADSLATHVLDCLERYSMPASRLVIELTETHAPLLADALRRDIVRLRDLGVRIALDDVGSGYSTLTRLTQLPIDILKIDQAFVRGLGIDPACTAVVRTLLALGNSIGVVVVAEGVETSQQAELLTGYGCDTVQGFLYSAARTEEDLQAYLACRRTDAVMSA